MTASITTTCATFRLVGPDTARVARGASGNCAPTGRCLEATSAKSHRSSSTASASGASASCNSGRALASPARRIPKDLIKKSLFFDSSCNCGLKGKRIHVGQQNLVLASLKFTASTARLWLLSNIQVGMPF